MSALQYSWRLEEAKGIGFFAPLPVPVGSFKP
jgi:hypothetical protein